MSRYDLHLFASFWLCESCNRHLRLPLCHTMCSRLKKVLLVNSHWVTPYRYAISFIQHQMNCLIEHAALSVLFQSPITVNTSTETKASPNLLVSTK